MPDASRDKILAALRAFFAEDGYDMSQGNDGTVWAEPSQCAASLMIDVSEMADFVAKHMERIDA